MVGETEIDGRGVQSRTSMRQGGSWLAKAKSGEKHKFEHVELAVSGEAVHDSR